MKKGLIRRVVSQTETRAKVVGEIQLPDGTLTAACESLLARPPDMLRTQWEAELPYWKVYPDT